jgi:TonB dependent receptor/TonB-dependent Receptor Plug Domain/Carboxypeptidase regulatory-like domain
MMFGWRRLLILVLGLAWSGSASAQQANEERRIEGVVLNSQTRQPVENATVAAGEWTATTDSDGRFTLRVRPGRVAIAVTHPDFFPLPIVLDVAEQDALDVELSLVPASGFSSSVDVVAPLPAAAAPATVEVAPEQVMRTPGALDNVFRTLQTLPGVSAAEEFSSRLVVRGGAPDQNLTMMDGVEIHDPYRLFGLTSAFNPETIDRFELATGGFSVKYGDRLSSLLVVENRDGNRGTRLGGSASLSVTDANVVAEGKLPGTLNGSWLASGRRTYYDLIASRVADQEFPQFADIQGRAVWDIAPGRTLSVFGLRSRQAASLDIDESDVRGDFQDDTRNDLAWVRFDSSLRSTVQARTIVAYSTSTATFGVNAAIENRAERSNAADEEAVGTANVVFDRTLQVGDTSLRQEVEWTAGPHLFAAGGELHRLSTDLAFDIRGDRNPTATNGSSVQGGAGLPDSLRSTQVAARGGVWVSDRWQRERWAVEGGIRIDRSGATRGTPISPRVSASWDFTSRTKLRGAIGRYTQTPGYEKQIQSDYVLDLTGPTAGTLRSEQAVQTSMGMERSFGPLGVVRLEAYYKRLSDLLIGRLQPETERLGRLARYDFPAELAGSVPIEPIITTIPTNEGRGRAYGFDLFVSRTTAPVTARLRGWASYTWGRAEREAYGRQYPFEYDRRHAFSAVASYRLSTRLELGATTRVASGFPRTAPVGLRVAAEEDTADRDADAITDELLPAVDAVGRPVYAVNFGGVENLNNGRLPLFARVDLRATWRPRGVDGRWELYAEVINLLNRQNAGSLDPRLEFDPASDRPRIVEVRDQSLPRFPTVGIRWRL